MLIHYFHCFALLLCYTCMLIGKIRVFYYTSVCIIIIVFVVIVVFVVLQTADEKSLLVQVYVGSRDGKVINITLQVGLTCCCCPGA